MLGNVILAGSNLYGLLGARAHYQRGSYWYAAGIIGSVVSAVAHHLFETTRHHMPGIGAEVSPEIQEQLTAVAFVFAFVVSFQTLLIFPINQTSTFWFFLLTSIGAAIPEIFGKYLSPSWDRVVYVTLHTLFHLGFYEMINTAAVLDPTDSPTAVHLLAICLGLAGSYFRRDPHTL